MLNSHYSTILFIFFGFLSTNTRASFIENKGQLHNQNDEVNSHVLFVHDQPGLKIMLTKSGFSYQKSQLPFTSEEISKLIRDEFANPIFNIQSYRIDFEFPQQAEIIEKSQKQKASLNYYSSLDPILNVDQFNRIVYKDVSPGVDVEFIITETGLFKYNIIAKDYYSANSLKLQIKGADTIYIDKNQLIMETPFGLFKEKIPKSYLVSTSKTEEVNVGFILNKNTISFDIPFFNSIQKLIIDPQPEGVWGTYFGGSEYDIITELTTDNSGNIFHCGMTMSSNNIATSGSHESTFQGGLDGFLAKQNSAGDLLWATYYSGPQTDRPYGLTTDGDGNVYLGGATYSEYGIATIGSYQDVLAGMDDVFVVKFKPNGVREWGTYIGGTGHDFVTTLKHSNGKIYITGHTKSNNGISTPGTFTENFTANEAGYLICMSDDGINLYWGTYIGENSNSSDESIALIENSIILGGRTNSANGISSIGAHQTSLAGFGNGFVQRFDENGGLIWGTYYGGTYTDKIVGVTLDIENNIYVAGDASSENNISTPGAYQTTRLSSEQGFLAKFNKDGVRQWGTYLGGTSSDYVTSIAVFDTTVMIGGKTLSTNWITSIGAYQESISGGYDGFVISISHNGNYLWGTYYGGSQDENLAALTVDKNGNLFGAGEATGSLEGIAFGNAHQINFGGGSNDGFAFKFCLPSTVTITEINGELIAAGADDYEWFLDGETLNLYTDTIQPFSNGVYTVLGTSAGACEVESNAHIYSSASLINNFNETSIYPNPIKSQGVLSINSSITIESIKIITLQGQDLMYQRVNSKSFEFELPKLKNGIYLVQFLTKNSLFDKKIIVLN